MSDDNADEFAWMPDSGVEYEGLDRVGKGRRTKALKAAEKDKKAFEKAKKAKAAPKRTLAAPTLNNKRTTKRKERSSSDDSESQDEFETLGISMLKALRTHYADRTRGQQPRHLSAGQVAEEKEQAAYDAHRQDKLVTSQALKYGKETSNTAAYGDNRELAPQFQRFVRAALEHNKFVLGPLLEAVIRTQIDEWSSTPDELAALTAIGGEDETVGPVRQSVTTADMISFLYAAYLTHLSQREAGSRLARFAADRKANVLDTPEYESVRRTFTQNLACNRAFEQYRPATGFGDTTQRAQGFQAGVKSGVIRDDAAGCALVPNRGSTTKATLKLDAAAVTHDKGGDKGGSGKDHHRGDAKKTSTSTDAAAATTTRPDNRPKRSRNARRKENWKATFLAEAATRKGAATKGGKKQYN